MHVSDKELAQRVIAFEKWVPSTFRELNAPDPFALFIKHQVRADTSKDVEIKSLPISGLQSLIGAVAWGGDAVADAE